MGSEPVDSPTPDRRPLTPDFTVVEIGTNHPGEIDALARIVRPDAAVIVSIGREHMAFFKTLEGVAAEEAAVLAHVRDDGLFVLPGDEPTASLLASHVERHHRQQRIVRFGRSDHCDMQLTNLHAGTAGLRFSVDDQAFTLALLGEHNALNALAAIAVARWMKVDDAAIAGALAGATAMPMRMQVRCVGPMTVVNDAYNANPDSMARALATLRGMPARRRVAILGDMLELGDAAAPSHRELADTLVRERCDLAILIGPLMQHTADALRDRMPADRVHAHAAWHDTLPDRIANLLEAGDVVVLKGSRGMGLERLLPTIESRWGKLGGD